MTKATFRLFSEIPPFITKPPSSVTVIEKQNVTLPCRAAGCPQPVITWYKNGQLKEDEKRKFKKSNLVIKGITFEDRGIYTCTAENLLGRVELMVNVTVKGKWIFHIECWIFSESGQISVVN